MSFDQQPLVAFNAHLLTPEASYRSAGVAAYIVNLLRHLPDVGDGLRYTVLLGQGRLPEEVCRLPELRSMIVTRHPMLRILWEQMVMPWVLRHLHADLLHAPAFVGPLYASCPQIVTVHDLSFLRYPQFFRRGNRFYLGALTGISCRRATAVIAVSDFTAREVTTLLRVPRERVHTIYHGVDPNFTPLSTTEVVRFRQEMQLPERFILYLGTLEPRKNLVSLVRAFSNLYEPDVHLVLAGGRGWLYEDLFAEIERLNLQDRVHCPGYIPAEKLTLWYNAAEVFAYISTYEGFGLPVLEALACGLPTLASSTTSLPEAAGDGALTAPPADADAITGGLHRLLNDADLRASLRARGLAHAARFSWAETARHTVELYRQVIASYRQD
ncbi:MAG: glycosyltransferase family 4 protein [Anaerolineae bacterium]|nr:glycosyltransferase family 4 protein [Anaerolineae bacterium]